MNIIVEFPSIKDFVCYAGKQHKNTSFSKISKTKWFNERFEVIEKKNVTTIESYTSLQNNYKIGIENKVETHEVSRVGRSLSPSEAQGTENQLRDSLCE